MFQARLTAVPGINIEHDEAGKGTGDDAYPGLRPTGEPGPRFFQARAPVLKFLPANQRTLVAAPDRDDGPAVSDIVVDRLGHQDMSVHCSPTWPPPSGALP
jgi:hypothetical protein